mmetsp:Transcript_9900/g.22042  ORF Transcript_9900/g.22042 Transcript_9900/m.22042 type:complete len:216 (+) Transcript_9900:2-649(+)
MSNYICMCGYVDHALLPIHRGAIPQRLAAINGCAFCAHRGPAHHPAHPRGAPEGTEAGPAAVRHGGTADPHLPHAAGAQYDLRHKASAGVSAQHPPEVFRSRLQQTHGWEETRAGQRTGDRGTASERERRSTREPCSEQRPSPVPPARRAIPHLRRIPHTGARLADTGAQQDPGTGAGGDSQRERPHGSAGQTTGGGGGPRQLDEQAQVGLRGRA